MIPNMGGMGNMANLVTKQKKLQEKLKNTIIRSKEKGIILELDGTMNIRKVEITNKEILKPENAEEIAKAIETAFKKGQSKVGEVAIKKMQEIMGIDLTQLG